MFAISQISQTGKLNLKTKRAYHKQNTTYDTLFVVLLCLLLRLFHLAQQLFLSVIQRGWQLHVVCNHQIAKCSVTTVASFSTNPNLGSVLRSRLNLEFDFRTIAQSDNTLATQQGRIHIDVYVHLHFSCALTHILRAIFRSATKAIKACTSRTATSATAKQVLEETAESTTARTKIAEVEALERISSC